MTNPRQYPDTIISAESGRPMTRGEKLVSMKIDGREFRYRQPGWWCSIEDFGDIEGQLVDEDNQVAEMARRTAEALIRGEAFTPVLISAIRLHCGLSQRDAGELFGAGEKAFEKYESGQIRPSEPTKRLLRLALERPDLFQKPPKGVITTPAENDVQLIQKTLREARLDRLYAPLFPEAA